MKELQREGRASKRGKHERKPVWKSRRLLEKLNSRDNLQILQKKAAPNVDIIYEKLKGTSSAGTSYEFPHVRTTLYHLLKKLGSEYQKTVN